jgi:hypothetical protein
MDLAAAVADNPYVAVVGRKQRNLKKKLEKITKAEAALEAGKTLDEEQNVLLSTKPQVERALADFAAVRLQLEEVAKQQGGGEGGASAAPSSDNSSRSSSSSSSSDSNSNSNSNNGSNSDNSNNNKVHKLVEFLFVYANYAKQTKAASAVPVPAGVTKLGALLLGGGPGPGGGAADCKGACRAADAYLEVS